jgi:5-methylcytosine-specific restriction endonuclease McrA
MTTGRVKRRLAAAAFEAVPIRASGPLDCALCSRPIGAKVEWHHAIPKSQGGQDTVPVHPICHRAIHAAVSNADLARTGGDMTEVRHDPALARFVKWVADKPPDFHAPTRRSRRD